MLPVAMPEAPFTASLLLVVGPGAPNSVLAPSIGKNTCGLFESLEKREKTIETHIAPGFWDERPGCLDLVGLKYGLGADETCKSAVPEELLVNH